MPFVRDDAHGPLARPGPLLVFIATQNPLPNCYDEEALAAAGPGVECIEVESDAAPLYFVATFQGLTAGPESLAIEPDRTGYPGGFDVLVDASMDPLGNCVYYLETDSDMRMSIESRLSTIDLEGDCGLAWSWEGRTLRVTIEGQYAFGFRGWKAVADENGDLLWASGNSLPPPTVTAPIAIDAVYLDPTCPGDDVDCLLTFDQLVHLHRRRD